MAGSNIAVYVAPFAKAMLAISQAVDVPDRFAETNSFYNGGAPNAGDASASALW